MGHKIDNRSVLCKNMDNKSFVAYGFWATL